VVQSVDSTEEREGGDGRRPDAESSRSLQVSEVWVVRVCRVGGGGGGAHRTLHRHAGRESGELSRGQAGGRQAPPATRRRHGWDMDQRTDEIRPFAAPSQPSSQATLDVTLVTV
jgi:hypothetical protein